MERNWEKGKENSINPTQKLEVRQTKRNPNTEHHQRHKRYY